MKVEISLRVAFLFVPFGLFRDHCINLYKMTSRPSVIATDRELQRYLDGIEDNPGEEILPGNFVGSVEHLYGALDAVTPRHSVARRVGARPAPDADSKSFDDYLKAVTSDDVRPLLSLSSTGDSNHFFSLFYLFNYIYSLFSKH